MHVDQVRQAQLARDTGLANNTVAAGYLELLANLLSLASAFPWDASWRIRLLRQAAKHPFINILVATTWHSERPRSNDDLGKLSPAARGSFHEWAVAQELWRRRAERGEELPEVMRSGRARSTSSTSSPTPTSFSR